MREEVKVCLLWMSRSWPYDESDTLVGVYKDWEAAKKVADELTKDLDEFDDTDYDIEIREVEGYDASKENGLHEGERR